MARFRRFRAYGGRFKSGARRFYGRGRKAFGNQYVKWGIGAAAGVLAPRLHPQQDLLITALAVVPVPLPYGIKTLAQGYVGGMILKPLVGGFTGSSSVVSEGGNFA